MDEATESDSAPAESNNAQKKRIPKSSTIYPDPSKATSPAAPKIISADDNSKKSSGVGMLVGALLIGLVGGTLLGRTVLKPDPTVEEATKVLFGSVIDEFSENFDPDSFNFEVQ